MSDYVVTINGNSVWFPESERIVTADHGRPRGYAPWNPSPAARALMQAAMAVVDEYESYLPLSIRQIFYRLVDKVIDKTAREYKRLLDVMNRGRRAGFIPFDSIRDDGITRQDPYGYDSARDIADCALAVLERGEIAGHLFQPVRQYVFSESTGMVPQLARVAHKYAATVVSSGGFNSVTFNESMGQELLRCGKPSIIWRIGDRDPSGEHVFQSCADDVRAFARNVSFISFRRLAVTEQQVDEFGLPEAPAKSTDNRSFNGRGTVQAEAIPPDVLAGVLETALSQWFDSDAAQEAAEASAEAREKARQSLLARWS